MLKAITGPQIPVNEGCFRPLEVICPPGTIFTAERPAPVSTYWETMNYVTDLIWKALAPVVPDRLTAGHFLSVCGVVVAGLHPDTGELFLLVEPQAGGWGAGLGKDGESGLMCVGDGETYLIPIEVAEARYGIVVDQFALDPTDAGAGRHRGGRGCIRDYRAAVDGVTITATFGRHKYVPWGIDGGRDGSPQRGPHSPRRRPRGGGRQDRPHPAREGRSGAARDRDRRRLGRPAASARWRMSSTTCATAT